MRRIKASDAFGLSLIREYPNPNDPYVKEIIKTLTPASRKAAMRILKKAKRK